MSNQSKNDQSKAERNAKKVAAGMASVLFSTGLMVGTHAGSVMADTDSKHRVTQVLDNSDKKSGEVIEAVSEEPGATTVQEVETEKLEAEPVLETDPVIDENTAEEAGTDQTTDAVQGETNEPASNVSSAENTYATSAVSEPNVEAEEKVSVARNAATPKLRAAAPSNDGEGEKDNTENDFADSKIKQDWTAQLNTVKTLSEKLDTALNNLNTKKDVKNSDEAKAWEDEYERAKQIWKDLKEHLKGINEINVTEVSAEGSAEGTTLEQWKENKDILVNKIDNFLEARNQKLDKLLEEFASIGLYDKNAQDPANLKQDLVLTHQDVDKITTTVTVDPNKAETVTTFESIFGKDRYVYVLEDTPNEDNNISGELFTLTYTDNSGKLWSYGGTVIKNIKIAFSDAEVGTGTTNKPRIYFGADPTDGWWYANMAGVTATITFYGEDGKKIGLNNNAYVSVLSLNSYAPTDNHKEDFGYEGAELKSDGEAVSILESTVRPDSTGKIVHANGNNSEVFPDGLEKYAEWDKRGSDTAIYGTGLFKVSGDSIILRSFRANRDGSPYVEKGTKKTGDNKSAWFIWSTDMPKLSIDTTTKDVNWKNYFVPSAVVHYWENKEGEKELDISSILTGKPGEQIDYTSKDTLQKLEEAGYELVSNGYDANGVPDFAQDDKTVHYNIVVKKKTTPGPDIPTPEPDDPTPVVPTPTPETPKPDTPQPSDPTTPVTPDPETPNTPDDDTPKGKEDKKDSTTDSKTETESQTTTTETLSPKAVSTVQDEKSGTEETLTETASVKSSEDQNTLPETGKRDGKIISMVSAVLAALGLTALFATRKRKNKE